MGLGGYRVGIVWRNWALGFGATAALWLVLDMPVGFRPARIPTPATVARIEMPTWPAPKTPIPGLLTTTGVGFLRLRARSERRASDLHSVLAIRRIPE